MTTQAAHDDHHPHGDDSKVIFGFWLFILTNFISFSALFATYSVLHNNTYGGINASQLSSLPYVLIESLVFLTSTLTCGLSIISVKKGLQCQARFWLAITFLIGLAFLGLEYREFARLIHAGSSWQSSAFLSSFFTLVGFHAANIVAGLVWMLILMIQLSMKGITPTMRTRFACLGLFWDYLNVVWVFIFTIVYLMGAI